MIQQHASLLLALQMLLVLPAREVLLTVPAEHFPPLLVDCQCFMFTQ